MSPSQRLNVAIAKQEAAGLLALLYDRLDQVETAMLCKVVGLLGDALDEPDITQVSLFEDEVRVTA